MIRVNPIGEEEAAQLSESVRCRVTKGDAKGRPFGTPRNPRIPSVEEFNPRIGEIDAGALAGAIRGRKYGIFLEQAEKIRKMTDEELLRYTPEDPISGNVQGNGFNITG